MTWYEFKMQIWLAIEIEIHGVWRKRIFEFLFNEEERN
jgi:hypothetical protein